MIYVYIYATIGILFGLKSINWLSIETTVELIEEDDELNREMRRSPEWMVKSAIGLFWALWILIATIFWPVFMAIAAWEGLRYDD